MPSGIRRASRKLNLETPRGKTNALRYLDLLVVAYKGMDSQ